MNASVAETYAKRVLEGDVRSMARLISLIEDQADDAPSALKILYPHTGRAFVLGITGPAGSGKSTLTDQIIAVLRGRGLRVGVIAVDPTSPFSGGAILGDRIRMQRHSTDEGVFIRSMATRGSLGGLAAATLDVMHVFDAAGAEVVLIETVGVGQDEVDIIKAAHTVVVVTVPGMGDEVQAIKAGILEIGDLFVVNKADRDGADETTRLIEAMLHMAEKKEGWEPRVVRTVATANEGVVELVNAVWEHRHYIESSPNGRARRHWQTQSYLVQVLRETLSRRLITALGGPAALDPYVERMLRREMDPYSVAEELWRKVTVSDATGA